MYEYIVQVIALAAATALLEMYYQFIQGEAQILSPWRTIWFNYVRYKRLLALYDRKRSFISFMAYIAKPIALCPYCNGTWLSIIVYLIAFGPSMTIFLFIGLSWFFIRLIDKYHLL